MGSETKRSHGFIMLGMESATAGCGKRFYGMNHSCHKNTEYRFSVRYRRRSRDAVADEEKALHLALLHTCVQIYTHPSVSQRNFSVMRSVQHKSTETMMKKNSLAGTWGQADRLITSHGTREEKKRMERAKKKRCGFI